MNGEFLRVTFVLEGQSIGDRTENLKKPNNLQI